MIEPRSQSGIWIFFLGYMRKSSNRSGFRGIFKDFNLIIHYSTSGKSLDMLSQTRYLNFQPGHLFHHLTSVLARRFPRVNEILRKRFSFGFCL